MVYAYTVPPQCRADGKREPLVYNIPHLNFAQTEPVKVWANQTKAKDVYRCTRCGQVGHPEAK